MYPAMQNTVLSANVQALPKPIIDVGHTIFIDIYLDTHVRATLLKIQSRFLIALRFTMGAHFFR